jgi:hypothetical protein
MRIQVEYRRMQQCGLSDEKHLDAVRVLHPIWLRFQAEGNIPLQQLLNAARECSSFFG